MGKRKITKNLIKAPIEIINYFKISRDEKRTEVTLKNANELISSYTVITERFMSPEYILVLGTFKGEKVSLFFEIMENEYFILKPPLETKSEFYSHGSTFVCQVKTCEDGTEEVLVDDCLSSLENNVISRLETLNNVDAGSTDKGSEKTEIKAKEYYNIKYIYNFTTFISPKSNSINIISASSTPLGSNRYYLVYKSLENQVLPEMIENCNKDTRSRNFYDDTTSSTATSNGISPKRGNEVVKIFELQKHYNSNYPEIYNLFDDTGERVGPMLIGSIEDSSYIDSIMRENRSIKVACTMDSLRGKWKLLEVISISSSSNTGFAANNSVARQLRNEADIEDF